MPAYAFWTKDELIKYVARLEAEIERFKKAQRWRPASEPPKKGGEYLVRIDEKYGNELGARVSSYYMSVDNGVWEIELSEWVKVTHWMPLPEPPERLT